MSFLRASASSVGTSPGGEPPTSVEASVAVFGRFLGAGRGLGSTLLPGTSPCGEPPEAEAEAVAEVPSSCEEPTPAAFCSFSWRRPPGSLLVWRPVMKCQIHGRNTLICQNHAIVCKIQLVAVIEVVLVIEIAIKDIRPIFDDCPQSR